MRRRRNPVGRIAVIGAGPSAVYALKRLIAHDQPLSITIFEAGDRAGVGTPYDRAHTSPALLSNIASVELPPVCETLLDWLRSVSSPVRQAWAIEDADLDERHFFPRVILGEYYAAQFESLIRKGRSSGHMLTVWTQTSVTDIVAHQGGLWVTAQSSGRLATHFFDHAILATGHSAPRMRMAPTNALALPNAGRDAIAKDTLGILGTSLSAIDVAIDRALRIGAFVSDGGTLSFEPAWSAAELPSITMMSRTGLLPEADFYCPIPYEPLEDFTAEKISPLVRGREGDLDAVFGLFLYQLARLSPEFLKSLGGGQFTPEGFAARYAARRTRFDPFEWARGNLLEVGYNARHRRTVAWRYALLRMHQPFGGVVHRFTPRDRARFHRTLRRVFVDNYAAVPPLSIQRLLALRDAGILAIRTLGEDYDIKWDEAHRQWQVTAGGEECHYNTIVDARGQAALGQEEFPFPTLRMQIRERAIAEAGSLEEIVTGKGFELGSPGDPLKRVHCLSLPFLLDRHPFIQGLTASEELGRAAAEALLGALRTEGTNEDAPSLEDMIASLGRRSIYLFADAGTLVLEPAGPGALQGAMRGQADPLKAR